MRRAYSDSLKRFPKDPVRGPGRSLTARLLPRLISAHIRPGLAPPSSAPILATLEVTHRCNLRCTFCESRRGPDSAHGGEWLFDALQEIGAAGIMAVGFTGGEPLLLDDFERLAEEAVRLRLLVHLNTNGTLINRDRAFRLLETGLGSVNVSLDGADGTTHDLFRGPGSFGRALAGIEALVHARNAARGGTRILLAMTLSRENAHHAIPLLALAREVGVDGCTFLPCTRFAATGKEAPVPEAVEAVRALIDRVKDPLIDNSKRYLAGMARLFSGVAMPGRCSALHTSILVSPDRKLYPCVPSALRASGGIPYRAGRLMDTFRSGVLRQGLDETLCRRCWWNCHRELDLALGVL